MRSLVLRSFETRTLALGIRCGIARHAISNILLTSSDASHSDFLCGQGHCLAMTSPLTAPPYLNMIRIMEVIVTTFFAIVLTFLGHLGLVIALHFERPSVACPCCRTQFLRRHHRRSARHSPVRPRQPSRRDSIPHKTADR